MLGIILILFSLLSLTLGLVLLSLSLLLFLLLGLLLLLGFLLWVMLGIILILFSLLSLTLGLVLLSLSLSLLHESLLIDFLWSLELELWFWCFLWCGSIIPGSLRWSLIWSWLSESTHGDWVDELVHGNVHIWSHFLVGNIFLLHWS